MMKLLNSSFVFTVLGFVLNKIINIISNEVSTISLYLAVNYQLVYQPSRYT
jgi:hypothetical protein